jgi:hypothetical protein
MRIPETYDLKMAVGWAAGTLAVLAVHPTGFLAQAGITAAAGVASDFPDFDCLPKIVAWALGALVLLTVHPSSMTAQLAITVLAAVASVIT